MNSITRLFNISMVLLFAYSSGLQNIQFAGVGTNSGNTPKMAQGSGGPVKPGAPVAPNELNVDLRSLPQIVPATPQQQHRPLISGLPSQSATVPGQISPFTQTQAPIPNMPSATSFVGLNFAANGSGWPPDTNGDVGPNHYMEAVNTSIGIFNKTGSLLTSFTFNSFWSGAGTGTACDTSNQGDPIALYDPLADRWIFADMAWTNMMTGPFYECFAISKTSDPVSGGWWRYAIRTDDATHTYLADYPKLSVWPDGIYMSANRFACLNTACSSATYKGARVWAFNRTQMESGAVLQSYFVDVSGNYFSLLPGNLRGTPPPAGAPDYFVSLDPGVWALDVWKFHVDWVTPANSTFTGPSLVSIASYTSAPASIPQLGSVEVLDSLGDRLMMQNQYRNINGTESLWLTHTVGSGGVSGIRWYQLNITGGSINSSPVQSGTYQPDTNYRWMPSLAVDKAGNMAVGYSVSSASMNPAIRYAGRLAGDPLNNLSQGEATLIAGAGAQNGGAGRWGDYTGMTVDPVDDCTFWYTNEYYSTTGNNWQTLIGSFRFPSCPPTISGNVGAGGVTLSYTDGTAKTATSAADGSYSLSVSYNWSGTITPSKACYVFNPLSISYGSVTTNQTAQNYTYGITPGCLPGSGIYDDTNSNWVYSGTWTASTPGPAYNSTLDYTMTPGDSASFTFSGTNFTLYYTQYSNRGSIQVFMDGSLTPLTTINASGALVWQKTYTSPTFAPGAHTVVFKHGGPSGSTIDIDAIQILATYDDTDSNWSYGGTWTASTPGPAYNSTLHYTMTPGDTASFMFTGTGFTFYYTQYSNRGNIQVFLDGSLTPLTTINASGALLWQKSYTSPTFTSGTHTVVFKHGGPSGTTIDVDAITIAGGSAGGTPDTTPPSTISDLGATTGTVTNGSVDLTWTAPYNDTGTPSSGPVASYLVRFSTSPIVDNPTWNAATPISANIPSPQTPGSSQAMTVTGLVSGTTYYFNIRALDAANNLSNVSNSPSAAASTLSAPTAGPGSYDDTDPNWVYSGTWTASTPGPAYGSTLHYTMTPGDTASFTFSGTGFTLYYTQYPNRGNIQVFMDGSLTPLTTINANGALVWQKTYTSPTFAPGTHTVVFKHGGPSGSTIDIDAIQILATYDDTDSNWVYTGAWTASTPGPAYGSTLHYTTTPGDTASFAFSGTGFILYYTQYPNRGNIQVFMDGSLTPLVTINASGVLIWQKTYISPTFAPGAHTVVFKHGGPSGTTIDIDAITIR